PLKPSTVHDGSRRNLARPPGRWVTWVTVTGAPYLSRCTRSSSAAPREATQIPGSKSTWPWTLGTVILSCAAISAIRGTPVDAAGAAARRAVVACAGTPAAQMSPRAVHAATTSVIVPGTALHVIHALRLASRTAVAGMLWYIGDVNLIHVLPS